MAGGPITNAGRAAQAAARVDQFAELMADHGGTLEEVGALMGMNRETTKKVFQRLRAGLGWQAK